MRSLLFIAGWMLAAPLAAQTVVVVENPAFRRLVPDDATVEKLVGGFRFVEGPAWNPIEKFLVFSDNVDDRIYRYDPATKSAPLFRHPSGMSNGNVYNAAGELFSCEQDPHRVSVTHRDGTVEAFPDGWAGKAFSSPNDVAVKSDGTVWFTDPSYALGKRHKEQTSNNVYCYDPRTKEMRAVATDFDQPNGLCFSPDESKLYIDDSGRPHHIRVFDVGVDDRLGGGGVFCVITSGVPDGIRCDRDANLWSSAGDGIHVFNPAGERLGKILVPETPANLCFGGEDGKTLFITARKALYRISTTTTAASAAFTPR